MRKKIFVIIISLILIVGGIIGIWYFNFRNSYLPQSENDLSINSTSENLVNSLQNDANTIVSETNNVSNESTNGTNEEINDTKSEINKTTHNNEQSKTIQSSTQSTSSVPSSNSSKTQTKENAEKTTATTKPTSTSTQTSNTSEKTKDTTQNNKVERCTNNNNHGMNVGNCGKWFNTKSEAIVYYEEKIKYWGKLWETYQIEDDEYYKNCPTGYEIWSCMYCSKWTINLYYR